MRILAPLMALTALAACNDGPCGLEPNRLDGSIRELYDIEVDSIRLRKVTEDDVTVEYFHGNDTVAKISATGPFRKGASIPLTDPRSVQRFTSPETQFPSTIERGEITFETDLTPGTEASGCFAVIFEALDGTKRSLSGAFEGPLEDATR